MTRGVKHIVLRDEAVRLRVEDRKSLKEISEILGISPGSLSPWLKPYPLSAQELQSRYEARGRSRQGVSTDRTAEVRGAPSKFWPAMQRLTPHQMARVSEAAVQFRLTLHGFRSFRAGFDGDRVDFLVLEGSRAIRIQVKSIKVNSSETGLPLIELHRTVGHNGRRRYCLDEIDFIVGYWLYNDTAFVYALSELDQKYQKAVSADGAERWDKLRG